MASSYLQDDVFKANNIERLKLESSTHNKGNRSNRPQVESAPGQIISSQINLSQIDPRSNRLQSNQPQSNRPQVKSYNMLYINIIKMKHKYLILIINLSFIREFDLCLICIDVMHNNAS